MSEPEAAIRGHITNVEVLPDPPDLLYCVLAETGQTIAETKLRDDGGFVFEGLEPERLYSVLVGEAPTSPRGVVADGSPKLLAVCLTCTTCTVFGRVLAYDGTDLAFPQLMRVDLASGGVEIEEFLTTDQGTYQEFSIPLCLGVQYKVYINRGLARWPSCQPSSNPEERNFRRESGTIKGDIRKADNSAVHGAVHDFTFKDQSGNIKTYTNPYPKSASNGYYKLVSLPAGVSYDVFIALTGQTLQESADTNYTMPSHTGDTSGDKDFRCSHT